MIGFFITSRRTLAAVLVTATALLAGPVAQAASEDAGADVKRVIAGKLPNVPDKSITAVAVTYAPDEKSAKHHHAGSVLAYVLSKARATEPASLLAVFIADDGAQLTSFEK